MTQKRRIDDEGGGTTMDASLITVWTRAARSLVIALLAIGALGIAAPAPVLAGSCTYFECPEAPGTIVTSGRTAQAGKLRKSEAVRIADWYVANHVEYDKNQVHGIDCTGFVSRVWALGSIVTNCGASISKVQTNIGPAANWLHTGTTVVRKGDTRNPLYLAALWGGGRCPDGHVLLIEQIDPDGTIHTLESRTWDDRVWDPTDRYFRGGPDRYTHNISEFVTPGSGWSVVVRANWDLSEPSYVFKPPVVRMPHAHLPVRASDGTLLGYRDNPSSDHGIASGSRNAILSVWHADASTIFGPSRTLIWTTSSYLQATTTPCTASFRYWVKGVPKAGTSLPLGAGPWSVVYPAAAEGTLQFVCQYGTQGFDYGAATAHVHPNGSVTWTNDLTPSSTF